MGWIKIRSDLRYDPQLQTMPARAFKKAFMQAANGNGGPMADYVQPCSGRPSSHTWARLRAEVYARDDYTCQYCGERGKRLECDHVVAISRGGTTDLDNLKTACFGCNRSKRAKSLEEWRGAQ